MERFLLHIPRHGEQLFTGWKQRSAPRFHPPAATDAREEGDAEGDPVHPRTSTQTKTKSVTRKVQFRSALYVGFIQHHIWGREDPIGSKTEQVSFYDPESTSGHIPRNCLS